MSRIGDTARELVGLVIGAVFTSEVARALPRAGFRMARVADNIVPPHRRGDRSFASRISELWEEAKEGRRSEAMIFLRGFMYLVSAVGVRLAEWARTVFGSGWRAIGCAVGLALMLAGFGGAILGARLTLYSVDRMATFQAEQARVPHMEREVKLLMRQPYTLDALNQVVASHTAGVKFTADRIPDVDSLFAEMTARSRQHETSSKQLLSGAMGVVSLARFAMVVGSMILVCTLRFRPFQFASDFLRVGWLLGLSSAAPIVTAVALDVSLGRADTALAALSVSSVLLGLAAAGRGWTAGERNVVALG